MARLIKWIRLGKEQWTTHLMAIRQRCNNSIYCAVGKYYKIAMTDRRPCDVFLRPSFFLFLLLIYIFHVRVAHGNLVKNAVSVSRFSSLIVYSWLVHNWNVGPFSFYPATYGPGRTTNRKLRVDRTSIHLPRGKETNNKLLTKWKSWSQYFILQGSCAKVYHQLGSASSRSLGRAYEG